jgi:hypothetical protein
MQWMHAFRLRLAVAVSIMASLIDPDRTVISVIEMQCVAPGSTTMPQIFATDLALPAAHSGAGPEDVLQFVARHAPLHRQIGGFVACVLRRLLQLPRMRQKQGPMPRRGVSKY